MPGAQPQELELCRRGNADFLRDFESFEHLGLNNVFSDGIIMTEVIV